MTEFTEWWETFKEEHDEWMYADREALLRNAFYAGQDILNAEIKSIQTQNAIMEAMLKGDDVKVDALTLPTKSKDSRESRMHSLVNENQRLRFVIDLLNISPVDAENIDIIQAKNIIIQEQQEMITKMRGVLGDVLSWDKQDSIMPCMLRIQVRDTFNSSQKEAQHATRT